MRIQSHTFTIKFKKGATLGKGFFIYHGKLIILLFCSRTRRSRGLAPCTAVGRAAPGRRVLDQKGKIFFSKYLIFAQESKNEAEKIENDYFDKKKSILYVEISAPTIKSLFGGQ